MSEVGIRALKQNASAVVARAAAGETITVTDRGRAVARLGPLQTSALQTMRENGRARPALHDLAELPPPEPLTEAEAASTSLSETLRALRTGERY